MADTTTKDPKADADKVAAAKLKSAEDLRTQLATRNSQKNLSKAGLATLLAAIETLWEKAGLPPARPEPPRLRDLSEDKRLRWKELRKGGKSEAEAYAIVLAPDA